MRVNLGSLVLTTLLLASLAACAPRSGKTHFDRWADQTTKRHQEEAIQVKEKEWLRAQVAPGAVKSAPAVGGTHATTPSHGSASTGGTSSAYSTTRTSTGSATKSRVIRPDQTNKGEEDEAIY